ncbi:MAG: hypothetical protein JWN45_1859 [Acidobacteriaceae bacterium]|nr:hypothetical protein [Acidobacteriaceae bacterium]
MAMVPWWKRLLYSLASVAIPPTITFFCALLWVRVGGVGDIWLGFGCYLYFVFSFLGWILAVPFALLVTDIQGWRIALWSGVGTLLGPISIKGISLLFPGELSPLSVVSAAVSAVASGLAALIYLLLIRREQRRPSIMATNLSLP